MITAELNHNPYLLKTIVKFNGQVPKINSQVEKYEYSILRDWIVRVPGIFYDEMNGYDFDLLFTGTKADFEDLKDAFLTAGISENLVRLIHKNELEGTEEKCREIDLLIQWLRDNPNRKFYFDAFYQQNGELFESAYPYVVINGKTDDLIHPEVGVEQVSDSAELQNTILTGTPILFCVDQYSRKQSREDLRRILSRADVKQNQLFFMIHPSMDAEQVKRVIMDLGVEKPQIVTSYAAEPVLSYLRNYPMTEYVREAISIFEEATTTLAATLEEENQRSAVQNADIRTQIKAIEEQIALLKIADNYFAERDNFREGYVFYNLRNELQSQISNWRNRKTKVVGDTEIVNASREYDEEIARLMARFVSDAKKTYARIAETIEDIFRHEYKKQGMALAYAPAGVVLPQASSCQVVSLAEQLTSLTVVTYEDAKKDLMSLFRFSDTAEQKEPVRVATCYYAQWREKAWECVLPLVNAFLEQNIDQLREYYDALAEAYHAHLTELITGQERLKDEVSANLSDDERKLQEDNDWLAEFVEQLQHIERA